MTNTYDIHLEYLSKEQQVDPSQVDEACDHDVPDPRLSGDVMVCPDNEVAVGGWMELIDICRHRIFTC